MVNSFIYKDFQELLHRVIIDYEIYIINDYSSIYSHIKKRILLNKKDSLLVYFVNILTSLYTLDFYLNLQRSSCIGVGFRDSRQFYFA